MDGLFPIIRRARRPLIGPESPPVVIAQIPPTLPAATKPAVETGTPVQPSPTSDAKITPKRSAR